MAAALALAQAGCVGGALSGGADGGATLGSPVDGHLPEVALDGKVGLDGGAADGGEGDGGPDLISDAPTAYPIGRAHSPMTPSVVTAMRTIASRGPSMRDDVFAKVGDSITVSQGFLRCFDEPSVDLAGRDGLMASLSYFRDGDAAGTSPFARASESAVVGWSAYHAVRGDPPPVTREVMAIAPRFALVMYGTNDIGLGNIAQYGESMLTLVERLTSAGVIPVLSSIPARDDSPSANAQVPRYNLIVRGIAQGLQVPFVDLHGELAAVRDHGLGPDGIHPNTAPSGACAFDDASLQYGYNVRNILSLEALERAWRAVAEGEPAWEEPVDQVSGAGTAASPYRITSLPFVDMHDTSSEGEALRDSYPCASTLDESGREITYHFTLERSTHVFAAVVDGAEADLDMHLIDAADDRCIERTDTSLERELAAGDYLLVVDTYVERGAVRAGAYVLVLRAED